MTIKVTEKPNTTYSLKTIQYELEIEGNILKLFETSDDNGAEIQYSNSGSWSIYPPEWLNQVDFGEYEDFEEWFSEHQFQLEQGKVFNNK